MLHLLKLRKVFHHEGNVSLQHATEKGNRVKDHVSRKKFIQIWSKVCSGKLLKWEQQKNMSCSKLPLCGCISHALSAIIVFYCALFFRKHCWHSTRVSGCVLDRNLTLYLGACNSISEEFLSSARIQIHMFTYYVRLNANLIVNEVFITVIFYFIHWI